jgi:hypothetical protein
MKCSFGVQKKVLRENLGETHHGRFGGALGFGKIAHGVAKCVPSLYIDGPITIHIRRIVLHRFDEVLKILNLWIYDLKQREKARDNEYALVFL